MLDYYLLIARESVDCEAPWRLQQRTDSSVKLFLIELSFDLDNIGQCLGDIE